MTRSATYGSAEWRAWKHRSHWGASDPLGAGNTALLAAITTAGFATRGFYDVRKNVTAAGGLLTQVDDVRGSSGFGPSLIGTGHAPTWDSVGLKATNTANTMYLQTAASALFDVSTALTLVYVGSLATTAADFVAAVADPTEARFNGIANNAIGTGKIEGARSGGTVAVSTVSGNAAIIRCVINITSASALNCAVANAAIAHVGSASLGAAGNNTLTIFGTGAGAGALTGSVWRAALVIAGDLGIGVGTAYTAAMTALATWAEAYHGAVAA